MFTSGTTITKSNLIDIDNQKLIGGHIISDFNLLKIYDTNIFTEYNDGTGAIISSRENGTIQLTCPVNNDSIKSIENAQTILSEMPRIIIIKINNINIFYYFTIPIFGLVKNTAMTGGEGVYIQRDYMSAKWYFYTTDSSLNQSKTQIIAPTVNDVFIIYATSTRAVLFKNNNHIVTHTTNMPTSPLSHGVHLSTQNNTGAGSTFTLGFMS